MKRLFITYAVKDGQRTLYKCFPSYTEEVLAMHPAISQVCCVEMKNDEDHRIKAFVAPHADANISQEELEDELRSMAEKELAIYQIPYTYEFRESLPTTAVGKVDFKALEMEAAG